ncbi:hypothetical protein U1Q18_027170 [Sarracenia purpurea var. burkii]
MATAPRHHSSAAPPLHFTGTGLSTPLQPHWYEPSSVGVASIRHTTGHRASVVAHTQIAQLARPVLCTHSDRPPPATDCSSSTSPACASQSLLAARRRMSPHLHCASQTASRAPPLAHGTPATTCNATKRRHRSPPTRLRISDPVHDVVYRCTPMLTIRRRALHRPFWSPRSASTLLLPPPGLN